MSLSIKATLSCNLGCTHCYENAARTAGNAIRYYNLEALKNTLIAEIDRTNQQPCFHGGEPLLMNKDDFKELAALCLEKVNGSSVQTNGLLVDNEWIDIFKKYKISVGVSIDGPEEMNDMRKYGTTVETTREATSKIIENILIMRKSGIGVGLITVLNRLNALPEKRNRLKSFYLKMAENGISHVRNNPMIVDEPELQQYALTSDELSEFFCDMADFTFHHNLMFQPYRDVVDLLLGFQYGTCVFGAGNRNCDWFNTDGEQVVYGDGSFLNCQKTAKEGVPFLRTLDHGHERNEILRSIDMKDGGCKGCPYWSICGGLCPSEGENGDWRAKTRYCAAWYDLYDHIGRKIRGLFPNVRMITDYSIEGDTDLSDIFGQKRGFDVAFSAFKRLKDGKLNNISTWQTGGTWSMQPIPGFKHGVKRVWK